MMHSGKRASLSDVMMWCLLSKKETWNTENEDFIHTRISYIPCNIYSSLCLYPRNNLSDSSSDFNPQFSSSRYDHRLLTTRRDGLFESSISKCLLWAFIYHWYTLKLPLALCSENTWHYYYPASYWMCWLQDVQVPCSTNPFSSVLKQMDKFTEWVGIERRIMDWKLSTINQEE